MSIVIGSNTKIRNSIIGKGKRKEKELELEIKRLNNIINELEKILQKGIDEIYEYTEFNKGVNATFIYILEKLQELKEKKWNI